MLEIKKSSYFKSPFFVVCFLAFFERFAYFGFIYISIYFYINKLNFTEAEATMLMGGFSALTFVFNAPGGYVADKILGIKRTMIVGVLFLILGYTGLAISSNVYASGIYIALALLILGSSLFKPTPTTLIASLYITDKNVLDILYTYFYMSINVGALAASIIMPMLAKNIGYGAAFLICSIGLVIGLGHNIKNHNKISHADNVVGLSKLNFAKLGLFIIITLVSLIFLTKMLRYDYLINLLLVVAAVLIFSCFIWQIIVESDQVWRQKMIVATVLLFYAIVFFVIYQQNNTAFMLFNKHHVNLNFFGININPQTVPGLLDTGGIIVLSPLFAMMYRKLGNKNMTMPQKFALGLLLSACAYGTLYFVCIFHDPSQKINFAWEVLAISGFFAASELFISALGVSLMAQLIPGRIRGFAMGVWFITSALGIKLGSYLASTVVNNSGAGKASEILSNAELIESFLKYQHLFGLIFLFGLGSALIAWLLSFKLNQMINLGSNV